MHIHMCMHIAGWIHGEIYRYVRVDVLEATSLALV